MKYVCPWGHVTELRLPVVLYLEDYAVPAPYVPCTHFVDLIDGEWRFKCDQRAIPEHHNTPQRVWD
jgi:hypothetical protein